MADELPVTWSKMRTFVALAQAGSVRGAAAQLHVTEPAVSTAVASIERQLRTKLTEKSGRGIVLTEAGRVYADYCRQILGLIDESTIAVRSRGLGLLRLGAVGTASEYVAPGLLARFRHEHPDVELSLTVLPRDELFVALRNHELDVVFAGRPPRGSGLSIRATRSNSLIVVAAPDHVSDPLTTTWLTRGPGSGTLETTHSLFEQLQIAPPCLTLGSMGAVLRPARRSADPENADQATVAPGDRAHPHRRRTGVHQQLFESRPRAGALPAGRQPLRSACVLVRE